MCLFSERVKFFVTLDMRVSFTFIDKELDISNILKVNYYKLGVLLDLDCPNSDIILKQVKVMKLLCIIYLRNGQFEIVGYAST